MGKGYKATFWFWQGQSKQAYGFMKIANQNCTYQLKPNKAYYANYHPTSNEFEIAEQ